jgi:hypothetical protein
LPEQRYSEAVNNVNMPPLLEQGRHFLVLSSEFTVLDLVQE